MGLFSFLRKNKQASASSGSEFLSRTEADSNAVRGRGKRKQDGDEPVDPVLPEKKRARRRLVGAIALVLAAIIGLPMLLDSAPKPLADDIAIQIPSKDKPFQPIGSSPAPSASATASQSAAGPDKTIAEPLSAPLAGANLQPDSTGKPVAPQAEPKQPPKAESKAAPQAAVAEEAARIQAILEGKTDAKTGNPKAADKKSAKFVVQVAALASQQKVNELQAKLKSAGIKSYTQKIAVQGGERIRVRVGPFASKEEADKMRARLGKLGMIGTLVPA